MQIPEHLKEFKSKNILLFVAGKQIATLYRVKDGAIDELLSVAVETPKYSDNEGIFQAAPSGRMVTGSVEIHQDEDTIRDFLQELDKKLEGVKTDFDEVYLFAPDTSKNKLKGSLPKAWQDKIIFEKGGNYMHETPLALIEMIAKESEKPFGPITNEEKKIMEKNI